MSFYVDFIAKTRADAEAILMKEHAPESVKAFILQAMTSAKLDEPVSVRATGHLYDGLEGDGKVYDVSNAEITVKKVQFKSGKL